MNIFGQILFIYAMTFAIAFFVALIIRVLGLIADASSGGNGNSVNGLVSGIKSSYYRWSKKQKEIYKYVNNSMGANQELFNYHHGRY